ncbi:MAG: hypothetical protein H6679_00350 [Epsilonproteobacteria bacterium]|nr:hypothetical protein [Campylobacterota bacterium]
MKKIYSVLSAVLISLSLHAHVDKALLVPDIADNVQLQAQGNQEHEKINVLALCVGNNPFLSHIAKVVRDDFELSDQLAVDLKKTTKHLSSDVAKKLFDRGTSLCLYLEPVKEKKDQKITVRALIKDLDSDQTVFDKKYVCKKETWVLDAHMLAHEMIPVLTTQQIPVLSTLAYCKQVSNNHKVVCISDYACHVEKTVVGAKTINIAPSWHSQAPMLFYSQFTKVNSRLMSYDLHSGQHKIVCSYDGITMQPSFSSDGSQAVLCLSGSGNAQLYLYDTRLCNKLQKRVFKQLTHNKGNNFSPCMLPDGNVVYCSDALTGSPQIMYLDMKTNKHSKLTDGKSICSSPSYCQKNNAIVYARRVGKTFQLCMMSLSDAERKEVQLTSDGTDKVEPSWSECGRYIVFAQQHREGLHILDSQIALYNRASGKIKTLTVGKEHKSFPRWTSKPLYHV